MGLEALVQNTFARCGKIPFSHISSVVLTVYIAMGAGRLYP